MAEARALFLTYDPDSKFETPEPRVLIADSSADLELVARRIAFARRVGQLVRDRSAAASFLKGHRMRFRCFDLDPEREQLDPVTYLKGFDVKVDLQHPELELTLVRGKGEYLAVTVPANMWQGWSVRRPRKRPFFHPSAIFPKLSRALVNMSRCKDGDIFLDPFAGTGSLCLEASLIGARVVAIDQLEKMVRGTLSNMKHFGQEWQGVLRADSTSPPLLGVDAMATDIPYGRVSSTHGREPKEIPGLIIPPLSRIMKPRSLLVLMHPQDVPVEGTSELSVEEEHHLHVHKLLTRTITILRRR